MDRVAARKQALHVYVVRESRVRGFRFRFLAKRAGILIVSLVLLFGLPLFLPAQTLHYSHTPDAQKGKKVYDDGCIACHGSEGKGASMANTVFSRPDTFPDFTDCAGTTPEPNGNWKA
ncbi:MAG TPA: c-type cytochrome, partial [Candidatus Acidoferrales bacterium]|nr:c-type cytochrome [Candidatus Acidoferrales bacterium]